EAEVDERRVVAQPEVAGGGIDEARVAGERIGRGQRQVAADRADQAPGSIRAAVAEADHGGSLEVEVGNVVVVEQRVHDVHAHAAGESRAQSAAATGVAGAA